MEEVIWLFKYAAMYTGYNGWSCNTDFAPYLFRLTLFSCRSTFKTLLGHFQKDKDNLPYLLGDLRLVLVWDKDIPRFRNTHFHIRKLDFVWFSEFMSESDFLHRSILGCTPVATKCHLSLRPYVMAEKIVANQDRTSFECLGFQLMMARNKWSRTLLIIKN